MKHETRSAECVKQSYPAAWRTCLAMGMFGLLCASGAQAQPTGQPVADSWVRTVGNIAWVDYAPTVSDPERGIPATTDSIRADLLALRNAGFTGLVTYGCGGLFGREVVASAASMGFRGVILGVWDPTNESEVDAAVEALTSMLEPFMMVFLGGTIGGLVISMYLPVFQMAGAMGG